ncbi:helix-turn-helix domain-containing protein [Blastococcus sp. CT_GayMR16]|uniref:helix-turn-helix domain-containing protein n=1 Tax=Blastococcus sp. CT_GayMR16 TaxID=2559607 RepID=UPI0010733583|nr:helix-turn-helix domain-containing protein [Blastococcus sp. CT_GayMR16]TFV85656.1 helix-turn-helix domain-containing protein [Blastococcus sp. CT_GayMR16]
MAASTREILRLVAHVNGRRQEHLPLSVMAALVHRSPFDLHRRFRGLIGETPKSYTSRVRLARAAADLLSTDRLISLVAFDHGFASHEVFSRAFTRHFGRSPRAYRARGLHVDDDRIAGVHAAVVESAAPCLGLYRLATTGRSTDVPVEIAVKDLPAAHALVMRRRVSRDAIAEMLGESLPTVFAYAQRQGLAMTGPPFARYPELGMGSALVEAGVTIAAPPADDPGDGIQVLLIPGGRAAVALHRGPYERLAETHQAVEAFIHAEGLSAAGPPWETYLTDPGERPDPETWETEIVHPVR